MKLAIAIAGEAASPSAFVVWRGFDSAIPKARAAGYHGVELALRTEAEYRRENIAAVLRETGMAVSCVSTGQVFAADGLYFTHPDAEVRRRTAEVFTGLIHVAGELGCMVNVGRARGPVAPSQTPRRPKPSSARGFTPWNPSSSAAAWTSSSSPSTATR